MKSSSSRIATAAAALLLGTGAAHAAGYRETIAMFKNATQSADFFNNCYGYAVFPMYAIRANEYVDEIAVRPILAPMLRNSLSLATSAQRPKGPLLRRALDVIRDTVRRQIRGAEKPGKTTPSLETA